MGDNPKLLFCTLDTLYIQDLAYKQKGGEGIWLNGEVTKENPISEKD